MISDGSQQKSAGGSSSRPVFLPVGTLYVVGTPIGNLDDISVRALRVLGRVSLIAAEHPSATQRLLSHHGIAAHITSYGPSNLSEKIAVLLSRLRSGRDMALVVDSGMPAVHDPGLLLISEARKQGIPITVVPGPSIVTTVIAVSGHGGDRFQFAGKLPGTHRMRARWLTTLLDSPNSAVFFCDVEALPPLLRLLTNLAPARRLTVAADITKPREAVLHGTAATLIERLRTLSSDAEIAVVLGEDSTSRKRGRSAQTRSIRRRGGE